MQISIAWQMPLYCPVVRRVLAFRCLRRAWRACQSSALIFLLYEALADGHADFFSPDADPGQVAEMITHRLSTDSLFAFQVRVRMQYAWERIYRQQIRPLLHEASMQ